MLNDVKIVYCLSDTGSNYYSEQLLLSLMSFKLFNPKKIVSILIDSITFNKCHNNTRNTIERIINKADEVQIVDFDDSYNDKIRSRLLKTTIREHLSGDILYLDSDTVVCSKLDYGVFEGMDIAAVYNTNERKLSSSPHFHAFQHIAQKCHVALMDNTLYNGGVIYSKDNAISKMVFKDWYRLFLEFYKKYGVTSDQISLYASNQLNKSVIRPLPGEWNCQLGFGINEMQDAKIIHTLISTYKQKDREEYALHLLQQQRVYESINKGIISEDEIEDIIFNAKRSFLPNSRIVHKKSMITKMKDLKAFSLNYKPLYLYSACGEIDVIVNALTNYGVKIDEIISSLYHIDKTCNQEAGICITSNDATETNQILEGVLEKGFRHVFIL